MSKNQFLFSHNPDLTYIQGGCRFGSAGAVSEVHGEGITDIRVRKTGVYEIVFSKGYRKFLAFDQMIVSPDDTEVADGSFVSGTLYEIKTVGSASHWDTVGLPSQVRTPAVGMSFFATRTGSHPEGVGDGVVSTVGKAHAGAFQVCGNPDATLRGGGYPYVIIQHVTGSGIPVVTFPSSGSELRFGFFVRDSSVTLKGE